jgi:hypothetical protein
LMHVCMYVCVCEEDKLHVGQVVLIKAHSCRTSPTNLIQIMVFGLQSTVQKQTTFPSFRHRVLTHKQPAYESLDYSACTTESAGVHRPVRLSPWRPFPYREIQFHTRDIARPEVVELAI